MCAERLLVITDYVLEGMGCCFCPQGSDLYAWQSTSPTGPFTRGMQLNPPRSVPPTPLLPNPVLTTGAVVANGLCLTANDSISCVPNGRDLSEPCTPAAQPCSGSAAQQWRMTAMGEVQSNLTSSHEQLICLDAGLGQSGQKVYAQWCVRSTSNPTPIGQLWQWNTTGHPGTLQLRDSRTCANSENGSGITMGGSGSAGEGCGVGTAADHEWVFPVSKPLTPNPQDKCHGCQDDCCVAPRQWEMPCQQQAVTPTPLTLASGTRAGCEGGMLLWSGDAWQQAPDNRKQHDPQWWVPLCFNASGDIQALKALTKWQYS